MNNQLRVAVLLGAFLSLLFFGACSDPADSVEEDAGGDGEHITDVGNGDGDIGGDSEDVGSEDAGSEEDAGPEEDEDAGSEDAGSDEDTGTDEDAGTGEDDPYEGRPVGQCTVSADCPDIPMGDGICSRALPGGACTACGMDDNNCPSGASCFQNNCVGDCTTTDDCAPGLTCGSNGCIAMSCVDDECPVPLFGCNDSGRCVRVDCSEDETICPDQTTCVSGRCIEDRAL